MLALKGFADIILNMKRVLFSLLVIFICSLPFRLHSEESKITDQEIQQIVNHPIYAELDQERQVYKFRRFEFSTGISAMQLKQNTDDAILIGKLNVFPAATVEGTAWLTSWLGLDITWIKGLLVTLGSKKDPAVQNSVIISPWWFDGGIKLRYLPDKRDGSSSTSLKIGYHYHKFPVITFPDYISKSTAKGLSFGLEKKVAFTPDYGLNFGFDFLWLNKLLDSSEIANTQNGIGYRLNADFYATIIDNKGMKTTISLGYGLTSYISYLSGHGLSTDNRSLENANHFEQSYNDIHLAFTARI